MKRILFIFALTLLAPVLAFAQTKYEPLIIIPGITNGGGETFSDYINFLYAMSIGIAALLAVIKIIVAGVKYMLTDLINSKASAKKDIQGALLGLLLILGAYLILNTINPQLTNQTIQFQSMPPKPELNSRPGPVQVPPAPSPKVPPAPLPKGGPSPVVTFSNLSLSVTKTSAGAYDYYSYDIAAVTDPATRSSEITLFSKQCSAAGGANMPKSVGGKYVELICRITRKV